MRISDWSSDVCSSDLQHGVRTPAVASLLAPVTIRSEFYGGEYALATPAVHAAMAHFESATDARSDSAYSGKALACLYADLQSRRGSEPCLSWHPSRDRKCVE